MKKVLLFSFLLMMGLVSCNDAPAQEEAVQEEAVQDETTTTTVESVQDSQEAEVQE